MRKSIVNILIRTDSSNTIGIGHVMRDLVLAKRLQKEYSNAVISFATRELKGNINDKIVAQGFKLFTLSTNEIYELDKLITEIKVDMIVIDTYEIGYQEEKALKNSHKNIQLFVLDDTYEKHYCDILLNHNISANAMNYKTLVPKECELRCGAEHTLLREEFYNEIKKPKISSEKSQILISMGGVDSKFLNIPILEVLKNFNEINIDVITTISNKNLVETKKYCKNIQNVTLHINTNNIARLMHNADLAILTPSVTVNEALYLELPFIAIKTEENQNYIFNFLKEHNYDVLETFNPKKLKTILQNKIGNLT